MNENRNHSPLTKSWRRPRTLVNNVIHPDSKDALGCGLIEDALDAPATVAFLEGIGARLEVTFQALLVDEGAENLQATVSNAVVLEIR